MTSTTERRITVLKRHLDGIELQLMNKPTALIVKYCGHLDEDALGKAYDCVATRHPFVTGYIGKDLDGYFIEVRPDSTTQFVVHEAEDLSFLREVSASWDLERAVAQLTVIRGTSGGFVAMHTDHAISDGTVKYRLLQELWEFYAEIVAGNRVAVSPNGSLPHSPARLLAKHLGLSDKKLDGSPDDVKADSFILSQKYISLSEEDTSQLVHAAQAMGTSVHALLCGTVLVTQRNHIKTGDGSVLMACRTPVNIRKRLEPPVGPIEVTNFGGLQVAKVQVRKNDDPVAIGKEVKDQLDSGIARGEPVRELAVRTPGEMESFGGPGLSIATVTNMGTVAEFARAEGLEIVDFQIFSHALAFSHPGYAVYTYSRRLNIQVMYRPELHSVAEIDEISSGVIGRLRSFGG